MLRYSITVFVALLCACSPEARLARLVSKHPELVKRDTITRMDTTITERVAVDTLFLDHPAGDTVYINKDKLRIKYVKMPGDTTYIKGECIPDTVYKKVAVVINSVEPVKRSRFERAFPWMGWLVLLLAFLFWAAFGRK